ncbi:hypothetical protein TVH25_00235 [Rhodococcus sp. 7Tela_A2]|uniref:hypothetical protein n=1 Tax=Rhodococcus sp. 7Tela_A2 TaxID=3093744 RepID=UPI003BB7BDF2
MAVIPGTRVVGQVDYRNDRFAVVTPVHDDMGTGWKPADPDDYPTRGKVFWWQPWPDIHTGSVVLFELVEGKGEPDHFAVSKAEFLCPVLEYGLFSYDEALERLTSDLQEVSEEIKAGKDVYAWCRDELLVGPLTPRIDGTRFFIPSDSVRLERVPYREEESAIFPMPNGRYYCAPTSPVTGHLDCRSDAEVLRTAVRDAVAIAAKSSTGAPGFLATKALMQKAADALREGDRLDDRQYKLDRIARALKICRESDEVRTQAKDIAEALRAHPAIKPELDRSIAEVREKAIETARQEIDGELESERQTLKLLREEVSALQAERTRIRSELDQARRQLSESADAVTRQLESLEDSVTDRIAVLVDGATDLLSDSILFRALGVGSTVGGKAERPTYSTANPFTTVRARPVPQDRPVTQVLQGAADAVGVGSTALIRLHAAARAGIIPIVAGNGGSAALSAYATAAFGARVATLSVAHDFLHPVDLIGIRSSNPAMTRMHTGLLLGADAGVRAGGAGMLVLESFNQAPTESYLLPWLQTPDRTIVVPHAARQIVGTPFVTPHPDIVVAATAAAGTTTAQLSPDIWGFAVAIDVPHAVPDSLRRVRPTVIDRTPLPSASPRILSTISKMATKLGDYCEIDEGVLGTARRFAAGLAEFQNDGGVVSSLVECVLVPALASSLSGSELTDAIDIALEFDGSKDPKRRRAVHHLARRFQRRFA